MRRYERYGKRYEMLDANSLDMRVLMSTTRGDKGNA